MIAGNGAEPSVLPNAGGRIVPHDAHLYPGRTDARLFPAVHISTVSLQRYSKVTPINNYFTGMNRECVFNIERGEWL